MDGDITLPVLFHVSFLVKVSRGIVVVVSVASCSYSLQCSVDDLPLSLCTLVTFCLMVLLTAAAPPATGCGEGQKIPSWLTTLFGNFIRNPFKGL